jgi:hypothetical protein
MALTGVESTLSEEEHTPLVSRWLILNRGICIKGIDTCLDTLVFLVRNKLPSATNIHGFNLVTTENAPSVWSGLLNAYHTDVTCHDRMVIFGCEVTTGLEGLKGLRDSIVKRAG